MKKFFKNNIKTLILLVIIFVLLPFSFIFAFADPIDYSIPIEINNDGEDDIPIERGIGGLPY